MICPPCKLAGAGLRRGEPAETVRFNHGHCESPKTCSCQHEAVPVEDIVAGHARRTDHPKEAGND
jgi:hypothetical protein